MDIGSLLALIENDYERGGSYDRYPVRFLSMRYEEGTSNALIKLQQSLKGVEIFDIKELLPHEDAWITADKLRKAIYFLDKEKSFIIIGFSEYARFLSEAEFVSLLISLIELENPEGNQKRRLYIPCFALYSQISKAMKTYHRRMDVYNPLLNETDVEDLPRIYFIDEGLNANYHTNEVVNSAEWFGMWRNPDIDTKIPIVCSSKTLAYFYSLASPDNVYNIQRIKTYQDILRYMYFIDNLREYKKDSAKFYSKVISLIKEANGEKLGDVILAEVNAQSINPRNVYNLWKSVDTFKRWLIQNYVLMQSDENSYLYMVMDGLEELSEKEFIERVYEDIFECKNLSLVLDRCEIIESIQWVEKDITFTKRMIAYYEKFLIGIIKRKTTIAIEKIDFTKDEESLVEKKEVLTEVIGEEFVPYLTCFSIYERQLIIWLYRMRLLSSSQIKNLYPALWYYVGNEKSEADPEKYTDRFNNYFRNYKELRLAQRDGEMYDEALHDWNQDENAFYDWYFDGKIEFPEIYLKRKGFQGNTYVLDGVGAEFLDYILTLLEKKSCVIESKAYGKCHLPSITSVAKNYYSMKNEWLSDYDMLVIHGDTYYHVQNVEKSLSVIENMIDSILSIEGDEVFAITADHGSSVGHKLHKKDKKYNFEKAEHNGRCYYNHEKQQVQHTTDYVVYDDESGDEWIIALNQQSLYNNSKYAVHGGATLEEVLVPIIIAHKGKQVSKIFRVRPVKLSVSGLHREVEFKINPMPKDEKVMFKAKDGTNTELVYRDETKTWVGKLKRGIEQDIEVSIGKKIHKFRTVPPTKMGDDLFDD
ncbi:MAG: BREX-4 system phosphatase PglZ [Lachnospiraceae bacterium]|nr:BREX-4 system phosphatase PglZ [Lachnospiraceae bacterium]